MKLLVVEQRPRMLVLRRLKGSGLGSSLSYFSGPGARKTVEWEGALDKDSAALGESQQYMGRAERMSHR